MEFAEASDGFCNSTIPTANNLTLANKAASAGGYLLNTLVQMSHQTTQGEVDALNFKVGGTRISSVSQGINYALGVTLGESVQAVNVIETALGLRPVLQFAGAQIVTGLNLAASDLGQLAAKMGLFQRGALDVSGSVIENTVTKLKPLQLQITHEMTMSKNAFRRLLDDINQNGIQEPVKYVENGGKLICGRWKSQGCSG